ncbi:hypothetical protein ISG33_12085 [Glaciecola sp. MH2013]|nr:hypothetical protein [Glaciecola sp. MH2013]
MIKELSIDNVQGNQHKHARNRMPERDLWTGIEQAIVQAVVQEDKAQQHKESIGLTRSTPNFIRKPSFAIAASLFIVVCTTWIAFESGKSMQGESLVAALSEQHQMQKQSLLVSFKDSPASTTNWQQQLDELDQAALAIKKALQEDPNNTALLKMLKHVYEQQMQLIERVHQPAWNQI